MDQTVGTADSPPVVLGRMPAQFVQSMGSALRHVSYCQPSTVLQAAHDYLASYLLCTAFDCPAFCLLISVARLLHTCNAACLEPLHVIMSCRSNACLRCLQAWQAFEI